MLRTPCERIERRQRHVARRWTPIRLLRDVRGVAIAILNDHARIEREVSAAVRDLLPERVQDWRARVAIHRGVDVNVESTPVARASDLDVADERTDPESRARASQLLHPVRQDFQRIPDALRAQADGEDVENPGDRLLHLRERAAGSEEVPPLPHRGATGTESRGAATVPKNPVICATLAYSFRKRMQTQVL
jgi:hypothetical protein